MRSGGEQIVHPIMNRTGAQMLQPRVGPVGSSQPRRKQSLPGRERPQGRRLENRGVGNGPRRDWERERMETSHTGPPVVCAHDLKVSLFPNKSFFQLNYALWAHDSAGRKSQGCRFAKEIIMT